MPQAFRLGQVAQESGQPSRHRDTRAVHRHGGGEQQAPALVEAAGELVVGVQRPDRARVEQGDVGGDGEPGGGVHIVRVAPAVPGWLTLEKPYPVKEPDGDRALHSRPVRSRGQVLTRQLDHGVGHQVTGFAVGAPDPDQAGVHQLAQRGQQPLLVIAERGGDGFQIGELAAAGKRAQPREQGAAVLR